MVHTQSPHVRLSERGGSLEASSDPAAVARPLDQQFTKRDPLNFQSNQKFPRSWTDHKCNCRDGPGRPQIRPAHVNSFVSIPSPLLEGDDSTQPHGPPPRLSPDDDDDDTFGFQRPPQIGPSEPANRKGRRSTRFGKGDLDHHEKQDNDNEGSLGRGLSDGRNGSNVGCQDSNTISQAPVRQPPETPGRSNMTDNSQRASIPNTYAEAPFIWEPLELVGSRRCGTHVISASLADTFRTGRMLYGF
jgi:hypothetical protein